MQQEIEQLEKLVSSGDINSGGLQHKQRLMNILRKQVEQKESQINEQKLELDSLNLELENKNKELEQVCYFFFNQNYKIKLSILKLLNDKKNLEQELLNQEELEKNADKK